MKIGLQNFQGIGAYTEIPIAPITLFYGPNSAGKSTVADAIEFLSKTLMGGPYKWREHLERHARLNRLTRPLKENFKGKPDDVVFSIDGIFSASSLQILDNHFGSLFTRRHIDLIAALFPSYNKDNDADGIGFEYQLFFSSEKLPLISDGVTFSFTLQDNWEIRKSVLFLAGTPFFRYSLPSFRVSRFAFNTRHPLWEILNDQFKTGFISAFDGTAVDIGVEDGIAEEINSVSWQYLEIEGPIIDIDPLEDVPICKELMLSRTLLDDTSEAGDAANLINLFMKLPQWSTTNVINIPPIRPIPQNDALYKIEKNLTTVMTFWDGLASDVHKTKIRKNIEDDNQALAFVNSTLYSPDFLDTGYVVDGDVKFQFSLDVDEFKNFIHLDPSLQQKTLEDALANVHLYLVYKPENYRVEISDVGVGISQVVPVLFGCWLVMAKDFNVHIQQPELHLHPKLQAQLADVFVKCVSAPKCRGVLLLESHSEHLLLRLLRRIRESHMASKKLGEDKTGLASVTNLQKARGHELKADQVSVVYVSKNEFGMTNIKPLRLSEDGEFIDRWPNGFFTERDIELFGEDGPFA